MAEKLADMDPIICIDFGNSYTKVAVRKQPEKKGRPSQFGLETIRLSANSQAVQDDSLSYDPLSKATIPTAVGYTEYGQNPDFFCGTKAEAMGPNELSHPSTKIYRNWKPRFFDATPVGDRPTNIQPVDDDSAALYGIWRERYRTSRRPAKFLLPYARWDAVRESFDDLPTDAPQDDAETQFYRWDEKYRQLNGDPTLALSFDEWDAVRDVFAAVANLRPRPTLPRVLAGNDSLYDDIASAFFRYLHGFVQESLRGSGIEVGATPVRITLPGFGNIEGAKYRLKKALAHAGWKCAPHQPVVSEPVANAVGFFTRGRSILRKQFNGLWGPDYREMFGVAQVMDAIKKQQDYHWVLTIDIGGYTTDFSMTGFGTSIDEEVFPDIGNGEQLHRIGWESKVGGVQDLDAALHEQLPDIKKLLFSKVLNTDQNRLERFHRSVFGENGAFALGNKGMFINAEPREQGLVKDILESFARQVCTWADAFTSSYQRIDELILTGGGFNIPIIRDTVAKHLVTQWGARSIVAPLHAPRGNDDMIDGCKHVAVDFAPALVNRCSTAIGGTNILFDWAD